MRIVNVEISNFRALQRVAVPLQQFSVLIGENDVGKTSFLYALDKFFSGKKLSDPKDWYKRNTDQPIRITLTFDDLLGDPALDALRRPDNTIVISRVFPFDKPPETRAILADLSPATVPKAFVDGWLSQDNFHFIPVRRDLAVQFTMNKTALLGKLLRAQMKKALEVAGADKPLEDIRNVMQAAIDSPRESMQVFLRQQLNNPTVTLQFEDLEIDPTEGVTFAVTLSDDRVTGVEIQDRGAGTQNNLIIALFRLIAASHLEGQFIFAMEEPENSLHPKAQRQLQGVIQEISVTNQVIVTTHSPVFIDRSRFESNILLTRTMAGNTIAKVFAPVDLATIRTDLGIRASDALLKGGGNCALLVEGNTEEDGFPVFMEMLGLSEFELGIAIVNMGGSDFQRAKAIVQLLGSYDIPSVVVLDRDAQKTANDLVRMKGMSLPSLREVFVLSKGVVEDYYPEEIVAEVINQELSPDKPITLEAFNDCGTGDARLKAYKKIMYENGAGSSIEYLKSAIGRVGTRLMRDRRLPIDDELERIFRCVEKIARDI